MIYAAWIPGMAVPLASGKTKCECFLAALDVLAENKDDYYIGQTCRRILDAKFGSEDANMLTIAPFVPA